jgi:hypothetical protein
VRRAERSNRSFDQSHITESKISTAGKRERDPSHPATNNRNTSIHSLASGEHYIRRKL